MSIMDLKLNPDDVEERLAAIDKEREKDLDQLWSDIIKMMETIMGTCESPIMICLFSSIAELSPLTPTQYHSHLLRICLPGMNKQDDNVKLQVLRAIQVICLKLSSKDDLDTVRIML